MIKPEDLIIDVWDDTPKGGMRVGMSIGVVVTHIPTGLVACCKAERSQHRNRAVCLDMIEYGIAALGWRSP